MCLHREDIDTILTNLLKTQDYEFISCESSNTGNISIGFLSVQETTFIKYRIKGKEEELHLFIKKLPQSPYFRQNIITSGGFHREVVLYNELLNIFHEHFQDNTIPKCYLARSNDIVVLEDLSFKGFTNKEVYEPFDVSHCEATLETIAKFHAASFIFEKKQDCKIVDLLPVIKNEVIMNKDFVIGRRAVFAGIKALKKVTEIYLTHYPTDLINKAFNYMENLFDKMKSSENYPNTLSHSDLWGNNIMFKYDYRGKVKEASIFDFQLTTYKAPSYDIQLFLYTCTSRELRDKCYTQLLKHYFTTLGKQLSLWNIKVQDIMTWFDFENMLKETLPIVISISPLYLHFILMPTDIVHDFMANDVKFKHYYEEDRSKYVLRAMQDNEQYKQRLLQAMTEFFNYFNSN